MSTTSRKAAAFIAALALGGSLSVASVAVPRLAWADDAISTESAAPTDEVSAAGNQEPEAPASDVTEEPVEQPKQGWQNEDGTRRYYDENGSIHKGWFQLDGAWYWLNETTGNIATGWQYVNGSWYWLDPASGVMATDRTDCNGSWSDFSASGAWSGYASGWDLRDGAWHWLENGGQLAHGWRYVNGSWYWMDDSGAMRTGWVSISGSRYHLSASGSMGSGWLLDGGNWYWLDQSNGDVRTGWQWIGGRWYWADPETGVCAQNETREIGPELYAFDSSCAMGQSGWVLANNTWYWAGQSGALESGWHYVGGSWYWMDQESKAMATGLLDFNGTKYYMMPSGAMATGWAYDQTEICWYYATNSSSDGHLLTGWQWIDGAWYWMDSTTAKMQTGWLSVGGKTYHLSNSGSMDSSCWIDDSDGSSSLLGSDGALTAKIVDDKVTMYNGSDGSKPADGLTQIGGAWFYIVDGTIQHGAIDIDGTTHLFDEKTGRAVTGWHADENGARYHYDEKGVKQVDCWVLDGSWYLLGQDGSPLTGWQNRGGAYYYLDPSSGAMTTGWLKTDGDWYWLDTTSGAMKTGWVWDGANWYYMNASGRMQTGWLNLSGTWYWLDTTSGAMGTGWIWDGGAYYFCASDGHWIDVNVQWRDMFNWAQDYSSTTNYLILVDTQNCRVGIYYGRYGAWAPAKEFICSPGAPSTPTVKGQFTVQDKGYVFGHGYSCYYYTQFHNDYLFHSVLYYQDTFRIQDGRLGQHLSHGCVRLAIENAKWIYDNIPRGTKVVIW